MYRGEKWGTGGTGVMYRGGISIIIISSSGNISTISDSTCSRSRYKKRADKINGKTHLGALSSLLLSKKLSCCMMRCDVSM